VLILYESMLWKQIAESTTGSGQDAPDIEGAQQLHEPTYDRSRSCLKKRRKPAPQLLIVNY